MKEKKSNMLKGYNFRSNWIGKLERLRSNFRKVWLETLICNLALWKIYKVEEVVTQRGYWKMSPD